ncbi:unnamed protein product [Linum tenue]|uniref:Uncharacterized protein n=1 Tax=Linum tenue TaxID=586396 RepID=A0AAV0IC85_9ROSI|nr:unnamed protein product [Linum tenue]
MQSSSPELLYAYNTVVSGFSAKLSASELQSLTKTNGFLTAIPDEMLILHTTHTPKFLGLELGKGLWSPSSLASDVIVGILDTGIWPEHPSFQDRGLPPLPPSRWKGQCETATKFSLSNCNNKLIGAMYFYKGINETVDYRSPRDSNGHGTHTASTAAGGLVGSANFLGLANGSAAGMKYTARIAAYKVCWALGCTNSDLLAAMEQAVKDGVDVLSLSLGGAPKPFYNDNVAIASFGAVQNGVFVSCSAGNSGPASSSVSNVAPWIMTVAASYTDRGFPTTLFLGNGAKFEGSSLYYGKSIKNLPIVYAGTAGGKKQGANYCINGSLDKKLVKGKIVVCDRGLNAGKELMNYIASSKAPTASIVFRGTTYGANAPVMAAFSSRGPSSIGREVIKPDITAPGVNILAAWPPVTAPTQLKTDKRRVLFNIISGTSMSCPHISGIAALLKSTHQNWSPAAIKSAMMTSAYDLDNTANPIADTAFAFGSGHVDPERASDPGLVYDVSTEDYLNYLCSLDYNATQMSAVLSGKSFECPEGSDFRPGDLNYPSFAVNFKRGGGGRNETVRFRRTVTNVGTDVCSYRVKVEEPVGVSVVVEPEVLEFGRLGEKLGYSVGFVAAAGGGDSVPAFGSVVWSAGKYSVRSPIAVTWEQQ